MVNITDPSIINKAVEGLTAQPTIEVNTQPPPDTSVFLCGGIIDKNGYLVKDAEVRELTGADEEAIFKAGSISSALNTALMRGVSLIGGEQPTKDMFDSMLTGDRDQLLLAIRCATFGSTYDIFLVCQSCGKQGKSELNLETDVETKELDDPVNGRFITVNAKVGEVVMSLPNGITQKKLMDNADKNNAELVTIVLAGCIDSVNGAPSRGPSTALSLGISDRDLLIEELSKAAPGPRLGGVTKACEACGTDIPVPLSLASLFRL